MACEASSRNLQTRAASGGPRGDPWRALVGGQLQAAASPQLGCPSWVRSHLQDTASSQANSRSPYSNGGCCSGDVRRPDLPTRSVGRWSPATRWRALGQQVAEAVSMLNVPLERIKVLNIGTTTPLTDHPRALDRAGYLRWATRAVDLSLIAASRGAQGLTAHLVGADQYQRFDAVVPRGRYRLDRSDAGDLAGFAAASSRGLSPTFVSNFTDHFAAPYEPCISRSEIQV
jgi:hypothetical protein